MAPLFPPVVQHITTNDENGTSFFYNAAAPSTRDRGAGKMTFLYSTPPSFTMDSNADLSHYLAAASKDPLPSFPAAGSSVVAMLDLAPNTRDGETFMHRTKTLDYIFMMEGELELELDGGEKRIVKKGEFIVQRACWHKFRNLTSEPARMAVVVLGSEGAVEGGIERLEAK